jgi:hypothetical protein
MKIFLPILWMLYFVRNIQEKSHKKGVKEQGVEEHIWFCARFEVPTAILPQAQVFIFGPNREGETRRLAIFHNGQLYHLLAYFSSLSGPLIT